MNTKDLARIAATFTIISCAHQSRKASSPVQNQQDETLSVVGECTDSDYTVSKDDNGKIQVWLRNPQSVFSVGPAKDVEIGFTGQGRFAVENNLLSGKKKAVFGPSQQFCHFSVLKDGKPARMNVGCVSDKNGDAENNSVVFTTDHTIGVFGEGGILFHPQDADKTLVFLQIPDDAACVITPAAPGVKVPIKGLTPVQSAVPSLTAFSGPR